MSALISSTYEASDGISFGRNNSSNSDGEKDTDQKFDGNRGGGRNEENTGEEPSHQTTGSSDRRILTLGRNQSNGTRIGSRPDNKSQISKRCISYNDIVSDNRVLNRNGTDYSKSKGNGKRSCSRTGGSFINIGHSQDLRGQEKASNDSKKRYTTTGSGPNPTTRYTRPSYTTNISSTPHASSSMSPALESNTESDYKALYEAEKAETTQLKNSISAKQKQVDEIRLQIEDTRKASNPGDPDRRKGEGNLSEFDEEMKILETLRAESEKLKAEHRALTRVVSHLM